jgi:hypothetical protein
LDNIEQEEMVLYKEGREDIGLNKKKKRDKVAT